MGIVLRWGASVEEGEDPYDTTVTIELESLDGDTRTLVSITEEGWRDGEAAPQASYGNCQGWDQALCCMKAWIEHDVRLRDGFFV